MCIWGKSSHSAPFLPPLTRVVRALEAPCDPNLVAPPRRGRPHINRTIEIFSAPTGRVLTLRAPNPADQPLKLLWGRSRPEVEFKRRLTVQSPLLAPACRRLPPPMLAKPAATSRTLWGKELAMPCTKFASARQINDCLQLLPSVGNNRSAAGSVSAAPMPQFKPPLLRRFTTTTPSSTLSLALLFLPLVVDLASSGLPPVWPRPDLGTWSAEGAHGLVRQRLDRYSSCCFLMLIATFKHGPAARAPFDYERRATSGSLGEDDERAQGA